MKTKKEMEGNESRKKEEGMRSWVKKNGIEKESKSQKC
jgi:hypothetical protein